MLKQLCINYCNETLQRQFNDFVLKYEQIEYEEEGKYIIDLNLYV